MVSIQTVHLLQELFCIPLSTLNSLMNMLPLKLSLLHGAIAWTFFCIVAATGGIIVGIGAMFILLKWLWTNKKTRLVESLHTISTFFAGRKCVDYVKRLIKPRVYLIIKSSETAKRKSMSWTFFPNLNWKPSIVLVSIPRLLTSWR